MIAPHRRFAREHAGAPAANDFAMLRAWREDHPPAALGKRSASPATSTNRSQNGGWPSPPPDQQLKCARLPFVSMLRSPRRQWDDVTRRTYEIREDCSRRQREPILADAPCPFYAAQWLPVDDVLDRDLSRPLDGLKLSSSCAMVGVTRKVRAKLAPRREQSMRRRPPYSGRLVKLGQRSSA